MTKDLYGTALIDYLIAKRAKQQVLLNNSYGEPEVMPMGVFFREYDEMPEIEQLALQSCRGSVLDIGAGAGSHALVLQERGLAVTALDISPGACMIMKYRGVTKILNLDVMSYHGNQFDTLLLLMNGIGLAGSLPELPAVLTHFKTLLNPGGQIIFDSSDIHYLYEDGVLPNDKYFGEVSYQYEYKGEQGPWFNWLYIDLTTLIETASSLGWNCQLLKEDDMDGFLMRLTPVPKETLY